jgi:hypothetical protein
MSNWIVVITGTISFLLGLSAGLTFATKLNSDVLQQAQKSLDLAYESAKKYENLKEAVRLIINSNREQKKEEV